MTELQLNIQPNSWRYARGWYYPKLIFIKSDVIVYVLTMRTTLWTGAVSYKANKSKYAPCVFGLE